MDIQDIKQFQSKLLEWYDDHARILPWRDNPTPYRVWISEIMLQQTRVDTVKPYFERFMSAVPTLRELAYLPEEQLLKLWEGLGYYSRAKNLKKAAMEIMQRFQGDIPSDMESLKSLPGIGPYSSGAIASIAFGVRAPAVDGNVFRVVARLTANKGDIAIPAVKKEIEALVWKVLPQERIGDFNQALMELGATVCLPKGEPKCLECPVCSLCEACRQGIASELPLKAKKKQRKIHYKTVFVMDYRGKMAIRQRPEEGLLSSLWEFPNAEGCLTREEAEKKLDEWGVDICDIIPIKGTKHIFTHLEWHMTGYYVAVRGVPHNTQFLWVEKDEIVRQYSIPTAFKAYTEFVNKRK